MQHAPIAFNPTPHSLFRGLRNWALDPLLLMALTSLPHWILGTRLTTVRPLFNYDAVVALMLSVIAWPLGLLAVACSWIVDGIYSASFNYHFHSPLDFIRSFQFSGNLNLSQFLTRESWWAFPFVACAGVIGAMLRRRPLQWGPGILLLAILVLIDTLNGSSRLSTERRDIWRVDANLVGTVAGNIAFTAYLEQVTPPVPPTPLAQRDVSDQILRWTGANTGGNVLLVLVESLGSPLEPSARQWLESQLLTPSVRERWHAKTDDAPFSGTTTDGEMRSLCDLKGSYRLLNAADVSTCLPNQLKRAGYMTQALHGFSGHMFDRANWWPLIGFDKFSFAENLQTQPLCGGVFRGVCDEALSTLAIQDLRTNTSTFVYLLTLNTHLPLTTGPIPNDLAALCENRKVPTGSCQLLAQHGRLLRSIADQIVTLKHPVLVAIVGDHAPPFSLRADRAQFSHQHVPRFILTPREPADVPGTYAGDAAR